MQKQSKQSRSSLKFKNARTTVTKEISTNKGLLSSKPVLTSKTRVLPNKVAKDKAKKVKSMNNNAVICDNRNRLAMEAGTSQQTVDAVQFPEGEGDARIDENLLMNDGVHLAVDLHPDGNEDLIFEGEDKGSGPELSDNEGEDKEIANFLTRRNVNEMSDNDSEVI